MSREEKSATFVVILTSWSSSSSSLPRLRRLVVLVPSEEEEDPCACAILTPSFSHRKVTGGSARASPQRSRVRWPSSNAPAGGKGTISGGTERSTARNWLNYR